MALAPATPGEPRKEFFSDCTRWFKGWNRFARAGGLGFFGAFITVVNLTSLNFCIAWLLIKVKEPTVFSSYVFPAASLSPKSIVIARLYWAVKKTIGFIFLQVKSFRFGQSICNFSPVNLLALFTHLSWEESQREMSIHLPASCFIRSLCP